MSDVLLVFGSKSDSTFYDVLVTNLKKVNISFDLRICSAHRTPEELSSIIKTTNAKIIEGIIQ